MNRTMFRHRGWILLVVALLMLCGPIVNPSAHAQSDPDAMYQKALQLHLQFKDPESLEVLRRLLTRHPNHTRARQLFLEMGGDPDSLSSPNAPDRPAKTSQSTSSMESSSGNSSPDPTRGDSELHAPEPPSSEPRQPSRPMNGTPEPNADESTRESSSGNSPVPPAIRTTPGPSGSTPSSEASSTMPSLRGDVPGSPGSSGSSSTEPPPLPDRGPSASSPSRNPSSPGNSDSESPSLQPTSRRTNLNRAGTDALTSVLGEAAASSLIQNRDQNGYFLSWNDLQDRAGLSSSDLRRLRSEFRLDIPVMNINTATSKELRRLPFIDQNLAENVVDFRFTYGRYSSVDELMDVPGFTESILNNVRRYLRVS